MAYNKVIDEEVKHPIEYHIPSSASRIAEQLFRYPFGERTVEEIDYTSDYLRQTIHTQNRYPIFT